jgi:TonB family protein
MKTWAKYMVGSIAACGIVAGAAAASAGPADDMLAAARDLYASAAYEEALAALSKAQASGVAPTDAVAVQQYRAFCLLALGRDAEAETAIEALVAADPTFRPASDISPRVRTAFSEVRRRVLPSIVPQEYAQAKAAFDRKDYTAAAAGFKQVLTVLGDPDVVQAAGQPPLSDVHTLAVGFEELALQAAAPPPPPPIQAAPLPAPTAPARPAPPPRVYTVADANVAPPASLRQDLPAFVGRLPEPITGAIDIIIDQQGRVESATIRESFNGSYDRLMLDATKNWRYKPAIVDGMPVKFRKLIQITLKATN